MSLELKIEKMADVWQEVDVLARVGHAEMEEGWRPYKPDWRSMIANEMAGVLKILVARNDGKMVGYLVWLIDFDMECEGTLIVHQGAWYVKPGSFAVAARMFDWAKKEWCRLGVKFVYLHNSERGRGQTLGRFFEHQGAVHCSNTYVLPLGG